ncbi:cytochrome c [Fulvimonas sp. R45]|uniref:c-type cytochrome n=1 Tax=Fulvimonas sp. R45 TaxID=3045937 RepID=UPI00265EEE80|nr:cytochrome c [Fulvimonas sp. R45]MDO1527209.1 cytochrome c [Fulvimonas sp. R45]
MRRPSRWLLLACALGATAGCERAMHDMYAQPKYKPGAASPLFPDGAAAQAPPAGTVPLAQGEWAGASSGRRKAVAAPLSGMALLRRGRERYDIYCAPCHGLDGQGDGLVAQRGFPAPPSYTEPRLLALSQARIAEVIRDGYGVMYPYGDRVDARDRRAIAAYVRALQLSQHAPVSRLGPDDLAHLAGSVR